MTIGKRIKRVRLDCGLSQKKLGELSGTSETTVKQYERELRQPRIEQLQTLADALKVPLALLLGLQPYPDIVFEDKYRLLILASIHAHFGELPSLGDVRKLNKIEYLRLIGTICAEITLTSPHELSIFYKSENPENSGASYPAWYSRVYAAMSELNHTGQQKAVERVEELAEIPKYQRKATGDVRKPPLPSSEKDTTQDK